MEIELGWGSVFNNIDNRHSQFSGPKRKLETERLRQLLEICEEYRIPFSFDVVGHLLLNECQNHTAPHDEWFNEHDPFSSVSKHPLYYAPDLVEMVAEQDTEHEICTHTFSHIPMDEMPKNVIDWELSKSKQVHEDCGYQTPESLIAPEHRMTPLDVLRDNSISVLRVPQKNGVAVDNYPEDGNPIQRYIWNLARKPPVEEPEWKDGVLHVYCSSGPSLTSNLLPSGQNNLHPSKYIIPVNIRKNIHQNYLSSALDAAKGDNHVHLWCHLWDLANDIQWPIVQDFLHRLGEAKAEGLEIFTLQQLKDYYQV